MGQKKATERTYLLCMTHPTWIHTGYKSYHPLKLQHTVPRQQSIHLEHGYRVINAFYGAILCHWHHVGKANHFPLLC